MSLRAIYFSVQDVGKHVKKSKRRFIWKFITKGQEHVVEMYVSYLSGKKDILLDSRSIYQAQKVTSSFQFPFQVEGNQCMIVQHGDQFELRINNQVFSHLYNQERMKKEFEYVDEFSTRNDDNKRDFGNKNSGYGNKNSGFGRRDDSDDEIPPQTYKSKAETSYQPKTQLSSKPVNSFGADADPEFGFAEAFDKFDYKTSQPRNKNDAFDSYNNKYSETQKASRPTQNSGFDQFESKKTQNVSAFDQFGTQSNQFGFDEFSKFDQKSSNTQSGFDEKPKQQPASTNATDLLGLDFGGTNPPQPTNHNTVQNSGGFNDFTSLSTQPVHPNTSQQFGGFSTQAQTNTSQNSANQNQSNLNDLMGLEFGLANLSVTSTQISSNVAAQNQAPELTNFLDTQPQANLQSQDQASTQKKKDLWSSELVNLDSNEAFTNKKGTNQDYNYGGYNNNAGYGNQNMGYAGNANYNANYGGYNTNPSYSGMNAGYNTTGYDGGQNNYGNQGNYAGNQGYQYGNQSGFATNFNNQQTFNNAGYGVQNNQQYSGPTNTATDDVKTPFDF